MIALKNITVKYGTKTVVDNVSAEAQTGEFIALVGPNGSGKSSLLKAIAGLVPHSGSTSLPQHARARARSLSYLAQNSTAPDHRLVEDIIGLGRTPYLGPLAKMRETDTQAVQAAAEACETDQLLDLKYGSLSGGEQMRVHLSRTLATKAPILLADEPTTALDPYYQISVMNILQDESRTGTTVIAALHDLKLAQKFTDRIWVMDKGKFVTDGPASAALTDDILKTVFRISSNGDII